jgi:hypothetical protein
MYDHGFEDLDGHIWELIYMAERNQAALNVQRASPPAARYNPACDTNFGLRYASIASLPPSEP